MKNLIIVVVVVLVVATAGYVGYTLIQNNSTKENDVINNQSSEVTEQNNTNNESSVQEKQLKVIVPEGWVKVEGSVLDAQYMKNSASFMAKTERFNSTDLEVVVTKSQEIFAKSFNNVIFDENIEDLKVGGYDAKKYSFTAEVSTLKMKYTYVYVNVEDSIYAITFGDLTTTFDNYTADYKAILNGISFE